MAFDVGAIVARLELNDKLWRQSIDRITKDNSLSGYVLRNQAAIQSLGKTFTIAGAAVVGSLGMMIKKGADYGDMMDETSQKTGVAIGVLSGLKLAADKDGTSIEGLAMGLKGLSGKIVEANSGNKDAIALFKSLGVTVTDANGQIRPMKDVLFDTATAFSRTEDGAVKTKTAVDLFGRAGMEMIPMLNRGAEGLEREWKEAERLGLVLDEKAGRAASDFNDQLENLKGSLMGVAIQLGQALMPVLQTFITTTTNVIAGVRAWAAEHPGLAALLSKVALAVGALGMALGPVLIALPKLIQLKVGLKAILPGVVDGLKNVKLAQVAASAAYGVAIGLVIQYAAKLIELKDAIDEDDKAQNRFIQTNINLKNKLYELVTTGAMTVTEFYKLEDQLGGSATAMALWISHGKAGTVAQEALVKIGKEHAASIEEQKKKIQALNPELKTAIDNSDVLGKVKKTLTQIIETLTPKARDLSLVMGNLGATIAYTTIPPARNLTRVLQDIAPSMKDIPATAAAVTAQTGGYFDGLFNDIATAWGNTLSTWLSGTVTWANFTKSIWDNIKTSFFRMVGEMVSSWLINGVKNLIGGAVNAATGMTSALGGAASSIGTLFTTLASTVGTILTTLTTAIATSIVSLATAIGGAIVALATSIATAATALAAAAPSLVIVGLIATGVYAATKLLGALLGGSSKQTDVTYWLKPISERAQEIRDWLFINAQERMTFYSVQIADLKTVLISHVGDRITALILQTGKQLQVLYQGTNPYLRVIAAESKWLSKIYGAIGLMIKALTSKHTIYVRDEILTAKMGEASQGIKQIVKPISGPLPFAPFGRPISGPVPHEFDIPNRPISGPVPHDDPKPKPKPKPIPVIGDDVTWLKRIHAQVANISNILVGVFTTPTFDTPNRPISGPIPGKTFGFGGPGGRGDINRASGTNITVQNNFYIKAIDSVDTERFINDKAGNIIVRRIQRAFKTRELHVPASAVGGS